MNINNDYSMLYFNRYNLTISTYMKCSINNSALNYYKNDLQCNVIIVFDNGMILTCRDNNLIFYNYKSKIKVNKNELNIYIDDEGMHYHSSVKWEG